MLREKKFAKRKSRPAPSEAAQHAAAGREGGVTGGGVKRQGEPAAPAAAAAAGPPKPGSPAPGRSPAGGPGAEGTHPGGPPVADAEQQPPLDERVTAQGGTSESFSRRGETAQKPSLPPQNAPSPAESAPSPAENAALQQQNAASAAEDAALQQQDATSPAEEPQLLTRSPPDSPPKSSLQLLRAETTGEAFEPPVAAALEAISSVEGRLRWKGRGKEEAVWDFLPTDKQLNQLDDACTQAKFALLWSRPGYRPLQNNHVTGLLRELRKIVDLGVDHTKTLAGHSLFLLAELVSQCVVLDELMRQPQESDEKPFFQDVAITLYRMRTLFEKLENASSAFVSLFPLPEKGAPGAAHDPPSFELDRAAQKPIMNAFLRHAVQRRMEDLSSVLRDSDAVAATTGRVAAALEAATAAAVQAESTLFRVGGVLERLAGWGRRLVAGPPVTEL